MLQKKNFFLQISDRNEISGRNIFQQTSKKKKKNKTTNTSQWN